MLQLIFFATILYSGLIVFTTPDNSNDKGINLVLLLMMFIGSYTGAYQIVGFSWWLILVFPLVEIALDVTGFGSIFCIKCFYGNLRVQLLS